MLTQGGDRKYAQDYRAIAEELRNSARELRRVFHTAELNGDAQAAQAALSALEGKTEELRRFREQLGEARIFEVENGVDAHGPDSVSFNLRPGRSRLDVLREAQELVSGRALILPQHLAQWEEDPRFAERIRRFERVRIDGHIRGGNNRTRAEQDTFLEHEGLRLSRHLAMPRIEDLAVAFAVHYIVTGQPLFRWYNEHDGISYMIRATGGVLTFDTDGLKMVVASDGLRTGKISVAAQEL